MYDFIIIIIHIRSFFKCLFICGGIECRIKSTHRSQLFVCNTFRFDAGINSQRYTRQ